MRAGVANIHLHDQLGALVIGIDDDVGVQLMAALGTERDGLLHRIAVLHVREVLQAAATKKGRLPESPSHQLTALEARQLRRERVGVEDFSGRAIRDDDAVPGGFKEAAIAHLGGLLTARNIVERHHGAVDLVVAGAVRADRQQVAAAVLILDFALPGVQVVDDVEEQGFEIGNVDLEAEVGDPAASIGGKQIERLLGLGREAAQAKVVAEHHDGNIDAAEQIVEIVVDLRQLGIAALHFLVDGVELFIGALELFLGGEQLFVGAL
jgi:hypothetical protein